MNGTEDVKMTSPRSSASASASWPENADDDASTDANSHHVTTSGPASNASTSSSCVSSSSMVLDVEGPAKAATTSVDPPAPPTLSYVIEDYTPPSLSSNHDLKTSYSWKTLLVEPEFIAAPVTAFRHAPMSDCWDQITIGMKVEVENKDPDTPEAFSPSYWVASILRVSGYNALLRYEGFGQDGSKDFWMNVCSEKVHPVGWCATKGKPLIPPKAIRCKYSDWKDFLIKRLTGARTLPTNFYAKVWESVGSAFRPGMKLEVVDKMRICQVRVATIKDITGRRLFLEYDDGNIDDNGFWCHEESPLIHHVGWAKKVGHQVVASQEYFNRCALEEFSPTDCIADMFPEYRQPPGLFAVGMKIEAVDPLNLASICVATVMKVLRFGYIMIRIDGYESDETGSDWFCYHASSPLIFPPGFCEKNNITLKPPAGYDEGFSWYAYLRETDATAAPVSLFASRDEVKNGFKVGMKLEAADQMDPRLICVSTVSRVVGRLLKVHFDGWEVDYDQWMDCENVDIYPVGWGELVGHKLEGPRQAVPLKKERRKPVGRKNKKRTSGSSGPSNTSGSSLVTPPLSNLAPSSSNKKRKSNSMSPAAAAQPSREATPTSRTPPPPVLEPMLTSPPPPSGGAANPSLSSSITTPPVPPMQVIPRLVDSAGQASMLQRGRDLNLDPASWSVEDVAQFLQINECATLVDSFSGQNVDGHRFLSMEKEDIMKLVNNKIGPCLKVENLLHLLKARMNPAQARFLATIRKNT